MTALLTTQDRYASYVLAIRQYVDAHAVLTKRAADGRPATPGEIQREEDARVILEGARRTYLAFL